MPAQHGPKGFHRLLPATNGWIVDVPRDGMRPLRVYISGDTLVHERLAEIPQRLPGIDVALLHLGGTRIPTAKVGVLVTLDAAGGVEAVRLLDPRTVVPIHTDDWSLFGSSLGDFVRAMEQAGLRERLHVVRRGETVDLAALAPRPPARAPEPALST